MVKDNAYTVWVVSSTYRANKAGRYWSEAEHFDFLRGMELYGAQNMNAIAEEVGSRSSDQVRNHYRKYMIKLKRLQRSLGPPLDQINVADMFLDMGKYRDGQTGRVKIALSNGHEVIVLFAKNPRVEYPNIPTVLETEIMEDPKEKPHCKVGVASTADFAWVREVREFAWRDSDRDDLYSPSVSFSLEEGECISEISFDTLSPGP